MKPINRMIVTRLLNKKQLTGKEAGRLRILNACEQMRTFLAGQSVSLVTENEFARVEELLIKDGQEIRTYARYVGILNTLREYSYLNGYYQERVLSCAIALLNCVKDIKETLNKNKDMPAKIKKEEIAKIFAKHYVLDGTQTADLWEEVTDAIYNLLTYNVFIELISKELRISEVLYFTYNTELIKHIVKSYNDELKGIDLELIGANQAKPVLDKRSLKLHKPIKEIDINTLKPLKENIQKGKRYIQDENHFLGVSPTFICMDIIKGAI